MMVKWLAYKCYKIIGFISDQVSCHLNIYCRTSTRKQTTRNSKENGVLIQGLKPWIERKGRCSLMRSMSNHFLEQMILNFLFEIKLMNHV